MNNKKRNSYELDIESVAYGGAGVGRREDGKVVFVKYAMPGERVLVREKKERSDYVRAELIKVLRSSQDRVESNCLLPVGVDGVGNPCFAKTPGCVYQEYKYEAELEAKNRQFISFVGSDCNILEPVPAPEILHYRNKIVLHVTDDHGDISLGYKEGEGGEALDMDGCPLANVAINETLCEVRRDPGFKKTIREGMTFTLRHTENDGVKYWRNSPPANASWLKESTTLGLISVPLGGFFQVNPAVADILIKKVQEEIKKIKPESVIDLYCGCGLFSVAAGQAGVDIVTGLDSDEAAIQAASYNAGQHGIKDAEFIANFADKGFSDVVELHKGRCGGDLSNCVLVVDPPRSGLGRRIKQALRECDFAAIIYISCAPDTLQRDLYSLTGSGYAVQSAQMLDMFPRTSHFESLIVLKK
jgi:23S rRNA (uracil1939-C5)-methyltransferase